MARIPEQRWKHVTLMDSRRRAARLKAREELPIKEPYRSAWDDGERQVPLFQAMLTKRELGLRKLNRASQAAEERLLRRMKELKEGDEDDGD